MKNLIVTFVVIVLFSLKGLSQNPEFVKVKEDEGVVIYERWIKFPKSDVDAREVKSEFHFNNSIAEGMRLLQDEKRIGQWQSHVSEFKVFPTADSAKWYEYSYHDIPWPVSDQDHLLTYTIARNTPDELFITFESLEDEKMAPMRKGVTRMTLSGSWTFEKVSPGRVKATYRILSTPLNIPKFLTDPIIRNNMMETIQQFIALLQQPSSSKE